ncbi:pentapeptide repeat-containing protein [Vibrio hannami]|uniref:ion channel n=1 Tax=Vibrio hannami TaxID=2717094 RepID=UPI0024108ADB|nr:ion channel [Vibrio hannami]MDG3087248.1 pentapeptide repeat-containing protein [Vibrio hannami]
MTERKAEACNFCNQDGWRCSEPAGESGLCYWHDPEIDKSCDDIKSEIEQWARDGKPLDGFQLARVNLNDINLVNKGHKVGYKCRNADFYRADLTEAHFFGLDLRGTSLMKTKLKGANLHCAQLEDCNLLGADLTNARLETINWGIMLKQEKRAFEALKNCKHDEAVGLCQEAEEVCRNIRKQCERQGLFETAGYFFKKEMTYRRYQMPRTSFKRWFSKSVDIFCGYGESPLRVVLFSIFFILFCALTYFILFCALTYFILGTAAQNPIYPGATGPIAVFLEILNAIYFSVVTFTTLGYGDISPIGVARFIAAFEAFVGSFTMALFVVVFVKKMTR